MYLSSAHTQSNVHHTAGYTLQKEPGIIQLEILPPPPLYAYIECIACCRALSPHSTILECPAQISAVAARHKLNVKKYKSMQAN